MNFLHRLAALCALACISDAFTPLAPPSPVVTSNLPETIQARRPVVTTNSNLPAHGELLQKTLSSTINAAADSSNSKPTTATSGITISDVFYDGKVPTKEADEYVVITNGSQNPVDISGYYVYVATTGTQGPTFTFPKDSVIQPRQSLRIYTNEIHKETGGYRFGSEKAIWNNKGGLAILKDLKGTTVAEFKYKPGA